MARYLVTGGAGFVGSHVVLALLERGDEVVVVDNLTAGHRAAVLPPAVLVVADLEDQTAVARLFAAWRFDAVLHFAALSLVAESMREPLRYCAKNASNAFILAEEAIKAGCTRFILSSTANVFGHAAVSPIAEDAPLVPSSAYGASKLMIEQGLEWARQAHGLNVSTLRYFNAAGADPNGRLGEHHDPETHLVPIAIDAALGRRPPLLVYGDDYPTPDGTCVRDYVHVTDLADAHLRLLDDPGPHAFYNIGTGQGCSVRDVIAAVERVTGTKLPHQIAPRRDGDPPILVAASDRLRRATGWVPRRSDIDTLVRDALSWRQANPTGYLKPDGRLPVRPLSGRPADAPRRRAGDRGAE